jgi:hypothetical protein
LEADNRDFVEVNKMKKTASFLVALCFPLLFALNCYAVTFRIIQLTDNDTSDFRPSLYNGTIAWAMHDGNDFEIYYWDGNATTQVTNNSFDDMRPSLYNGTIAWIGSDGNDFEVYYWDGNDVAQVTNNDVFNEFVLSLYDGTIAWVAASYSSPEELYYWDGSDITNLMELTNSNGLSLYNGTIAFSALGNDYDIFYWDGNTTINLTENTGNGPEGSPSLYNGTIAWAGVDPNDDDDEIFYWDGNNITNVSNSNIWDQSPSLHDGTIAWMGRPDAPYENEYEIYYWDGNATTRVTNNSFDDKFPSLYNGTIAWMGHDGNDWEIYYAVPFLDITSVSVDRQPPDYQRGDPITYTIAYSLTNVPSGATYDVKGIVKPLFEKNCKKEPPKTGRKGTANGQAYDVGEGSYVMTIDYRPNNPEKHYVIPRCAEEDKHVTIKYIVKLYNPGTTELVAKDVHIERKQVFVESTGGGGGCYCHF